MKAFVMGGPMDGSVVELDWRDGTRREFPTIMQEHGVITRRGVHRYRFDGLALRYEGTIWDEKENSTP